MEINPSQPTCWQCKELKDSSWTFCPNCAARLKATRTPVPHDERLEALFLADLYSFGWYNHQVAAIALYNSVAQIEQFYGPQRKKDLVPLIDDRARAQQLLRAKIFVETIAMCEGFGVLCLAIKKRRKQNIIWTYLNTEPGEVTGFYKEILSNPKSIDKLLNFPSLNRIESAQKTRPNAEPLDRGVLEAAYNNLSANLPILADIYCNEGRDTRRKRGGANVRIYNRLKHVFSVVDGEGWLTLNEEQRPLELNEIMVLVEYDDTREPGNLVGRLSMSQDSAIQELQNIRFATHMGATLLEICRGLDQLDLLFL